MKSKNSMKNAWIVFAAAAAASVAFYAFIREGPVFNIGSNALTVLSVLVAFFMGLCVLEIMGAKSPQGKSLFFMTIGLGFWFLGEVSWAIYDILAETVPLVTVGDVFWIIGFLPIFIGIFSAIKSAKRFISQKRTAYVVLIGLVILALGIKMLVYPIISETEVSMIERIVTVIYPVLDIAIIISVACLAVGLYGSYSAPAWFFMAGGMLFIGIADGLYSHLSWNEIYFTAEAGLKNWILSAAADIGWILGYLLIAMGFRYQKTIIKK